jgi:hypothetical protein
LFHDWQFFYWRIDPDFGWFEWRVWWFFDEAFGIRSIGKIEDFLSGDVDFISLSIVDLVGRHQSDSGMMMITIIPVEKIAAEYLRVFDAAEPFWKLRLIFQGLEQLSENGLSLEV